jgi:hypothetical protein
MARTKIRRRRREQNAWAWLRSQEQERADAERLRREAEEIIEENDLIRHCIALEGEFSFWRWYEGQALTARGLRVERLRERLRKHEQSVAREAGDGKKSSEKAEGKQETPPCPPQTESAFGEGGEGEGNEEEGGEDER